ncbi:hypothetical protein Lpl14_04961 [Lacticaseibacillus paracasei subsp. tolerans Lpl14]|uniref:Uncharacterized protein n=2 Tax=Lacticaseibacillus paracasei TaxID=1597 RepID=A0A829GXR1_LACPA|nr:hypothetical protein Lpl14_04961 [Lacticaseibacillus paracasei subsp. tolerans Lpl14]
MCCNRPGSILHGIYHSGKPKVPLNWAFMPLLQLCPVANQLIAMLTSDDGHSYIKTRSLAPKPACKNLDCNDQSPVITVKAAYTSVTERANSRSVKISLALLA